MTFGHQINKFPGELKVSGQQVETNLEAGATASQSINNAFMRKCLGITLDEKTRQEQMNVQKPKQRAEIVGLIKMCKFI